MVRQKMNLVSKNILTALVVGMLAACGGGGGGDSPPDEKKSNNQEEDKKKRPLTTANILGKVTYDYVPVMVDASAKAKLDFSKIEKRPARSVVVEIVDANSKETLVNTSTDEAGDYAAEVPLGSNVFVRLRPILLTGAPFPSNVIGILDNTQDDAEVVGIRPPFIASVERITENIHAPSGWSGAGYTGARLAAPFAILDTVHTNILKIRSVDSSAVFPTLPIFWSPQNIGVPGDRKLGQVGGTHFVGYTDKEGKRHREIYLLGKASNDTDEFDHHVISHEFGHYLQDAFSRDDSIGGQHSMNERIGVDMRLAFSEGWGNAWAAIALNDKTVANTLVPNEFLGYSIDVSAGGRVNPGWFNELSVTKLFWDMNARPEIGFKPIWNSIRSGMTKSSALTSIHSFAFDLAQANPSLAVPLAAVLSDQKVALPTDPYGTGETNFGAPEISTVNPIYMRYAGLGSKLPEVCVSNKADPSKAQNRIGEIRYVRITLPAGARTISVTKNAATPTTTNPDFIFYGPNGEGLSANSNVPNSEIARGELKVAGEFVLAITDETFGSDATPRVACFDVVVN
jgi:hypothetical protein